MTPRLDDNASFPVKIRQYLWSQHCLKIHSGLWRILLPWIILNWQCLLSVFCIFLQSCFRKFLFCLYVSTVHITFGIIDSNSGGTCSSHITYRYLLWRRSLELMGRQIERLRWAYLQICRQRSSFSWTQEYKYLKYALLLQFVDFIFYLNPVCYM
jgi:hypothetical protein